MLRGSVNNTTNPTNSDANFKQVSLLLHGDGTNGAQNNTFLDSSTNNFTVTRNGNTTQGTNTPFSQAAGYWSNYFDGSSYLPTPSSSAFTIGTGDFTAEAWIYYSTQTSYQTIFTIGSSDSLNVFIRFGEAAYGNKIQCALTASTASTVWSCALTKDDFNGKWMHVALTRTSSVCRFFVNGQLQNINSGLNPSTYPYTSFTDTTDITSTACVVAANWAGVIPFYGYISNFRYVKGTSLYTSSFTPSTTPLTAVSGTQLLTCQSNYFKDNSSNNFALTITGTPSVQPFSPFAPTSAYSTSVNGGSMYFDGTGDYLDVATNAAFTYGVSDFTMECWVYLTTTGAIQYVIDQRNSGTANAVIPAIYVSAANVLTYFVSNAAQITGTTVLKANAWYHVAVSRSTLSTKMFLNGVQEGSTYTDANSYVASRVVVASNAATVGNYLTGYTSNVRLVNGTAVYTANFTPPTAPLTAITNTSLLLSGTNAGIYDNAIKNDLETVGSAQVSTSVVKYGTGSMSFNGTTDYLTLPSTPNLAMGSGNFTWECWVYINAFSTFQAFIDSRTGTANAGLYFGINSSTNNIIIFNNSGSILTSSTTLSSTTWTHVALVRNAGTLTIYINGVSVGSVANTYDLSSTLYGIGSNVPTPSGIYLNGYIDDLRITKGIARYTANFTPPTQAFPNQ